MANYASTIYEVYSDEESIKKIAKMLDCGDGYNEEYEAQIYDVKIDKENPKRLTFWTETKWERNFDIENDIIGMYDAEVYFQEEELGCGIFRTNDEDFSIFKDRYYIDLWGEGEYCNTIEEVIEYINRWYEEEFERPLPFELHNVEDVRRLQKYEDDLADDPFGFYECTLA